ncbi:acetyl-CoA carboxylase biotin carboxyl carrier protein [bacterium]|nr:acetyl-CoA carboxylase biotin carboxyl carrier protein [bacterium]
MNIKELKEIIAIFQEADIEELEIEREDAKIRLKRHSEPEVRHIAAQPHISVAESIGPDIGKVEEKNEGLVEIKTPMVGTFYKAPAPDVDPFVDIDSKVTEDTVVCIIEAMKLMNEIKADVNGRIVKILVNNGQPVEFGQTLFLVKPE